MFGLEVRLVTSMHFLDVVDLVVGAGTPLLGYCFVYKDSKKKEVRVYKSDQHETVIGRSMSCAYCFK